MIDLPTRYPPGRSSRLIRSDVLTDADESVTAATRDLTKIEAAPGPRFHLPTVEHQGIRMDAREPEGSGLALNSVEIPTRGLPFVWSWGFRNTDTSSFT